MAEHTLITTEPNAEAQALNKLRVAPAAHLAQAMADAQVDGERSVALRETPFAVQLGVRAVLGTASAEAIEGILGFELPTEHGQTTGNPDGVHALWIGPDEFLIVDPSRQQVQGEATTLQVALDGLPGQVLDLSANRTLLTLTGNSARAVLEKGCPADLHPRVFAVGTAIATELGPVPVLLHRSGEQEYRIYPRASFADFVVRWILDASVEFASPEVP
ncbi:sarcosine oxidase subunit gamma [Glutamicibacter endophyticus]|uniref:sarcosine oxidase subunit gamma n=1 Tax=Glutamicibacter endophyticus TaxID=1522174 RepID=UPI003AEF4BC2